MNNEHLELVNLNNSCAQNIVLVLTVTLVNGVCALYTVVRDCHKKGKKIEYFVSREGDATFRQGKQYCTEQGGMMVDMTDLDHSCFRAFLRQNKDNIESIAFYLDNATRDKCSYYDEDGAITQGACNRGLTPICCRNVWTHIHVS